MDEQQPTQVRSTPYSSPMHNYGSSIIFMTSPEDDLREMELALRSLSENTDGSYELVGVPLMNNYGINKILMLIRAILNRSTFMGNFKDRHIEGIMDLVGDTLSRTLMINKNRFGIIDMSTRDEISFIVSMSCYIALSRGKDEGEKRFWKGSTQEITTNVSGNQPRNGFMRRYMGWGTGGKG